MPRPRVHDLDSVLDAVEELAVRAGPAAVSIRAISAAVGGDRIGTYIAWPGDDAQPRPRTRTCPGRAFCRPVRAAARPSGASQHERIE
ncbi:hypothetical protein A5714_14075 [Mycobacterium sp. E2462]|nr:hypothetical protein A5714_14075 [Mycobacterium sp. E2462]